ncbi:unnamed protein product, partial [Mesorhabditis belari]|uniref:Uncharacterized protein n=1 Tax=Mesorhabditis belari TaxID=2138241 RepID=A0AAF3EAT1_9BILA
MKGLFLCLLIAASFSLSIACARFQKHANLFCKFDKEAKPCLQKNVASEERICCGKAGGCSLQEFNKERVCCFTQDCLDRCYPGKGHKMGNVY